MNGSGAARRAPAMGGQPGMGQSFAAQPGMTQQASDMARAQAVRDSAAQNRAAYMAQQGQPAMPTQQPAMGPLMNQNNGRYEFNNWAGAKPDIYEDGAPNYLDAYKLKNFMKDNVPLSMRVGATGVASPFAAPQPTTPVGSSPGFYGMSRRR